MHGEPKTDGEVVVVIDVHTHYLPTDVVTAGSLTRFDEPYVVRMIGGVLDAFPRLKVLIAHGGGSCPYIVGRWDRGWQVRSEAKHLAAAPSSYLHRLGFDSLTHGAEPLRYLLGVSDSHHVLLGTDYPYDMGEPDPVGVITHASLDDEERTRILGGNAAEWFGIARA